MTTDLLSTSDRCPVFTPVQTERLAAMHTAAWQTRERLAVVEHKSGDTLQGVILARCGSQARDAGVLWCVHQDLSKVHYRRMREAACIIERLNNHAEAAERHAEVHAKARRRMLREVRLSESKMEAK